MKYVLYFSSKSCISIFFTDIFRKKPKNYTYQYICHWSSVYLCHAVCLWNMYIKLLIVKMSGEYLYFSLSASLNVKTLCNIYVIALLNISNLLFILSLVALEIGA